MAAELAEVDRQRRDLIANVSHELRTPISALRATLENLVDGVVPADPELLRTMLAQTERLQRLVTAAARPEPARVRRLPLHPRALPGGGAARRRRPTRPPALARPRRSRSTSTPTTRGRRRPRTPPSGAGQPGRERRPVHARRRRGRALGAAPPARTVVFEVIDHGPGIPESDRDPRLRALLPRRRGPVVRRRWRRPRPGHRPVDRRPARRPHPRRAVHAARLPHGRRAAGDGGGGFLTASGGGGAGANGRRSAASCTANRGGDDDRSLPTEDELRERLTPLQFEVTQKAGTEPAFTGEYWDSHDPGTYHCIVCDEPLFNSDTKFDSGTGWPSFWRADRPGEGRAHRGPGPRHGPHRGPLRTLRRAPRPRVPRRPEPTGERYCMNSASLKLEKA